MTVKRWTTWVTLAAVSFVLTGCQLSVRGGALVMDGAGETQAPRAAADLVGPFTWQDLENTRNAREYIRIMEAICHEYDSLAGRLNEEQRKNGALGVENQQIKDRMAALEREIERLRASRPLPPAPTAADPVPVATIEFSTDVLFGSGSNVLTDEGRRRLTEAAATLRARYPGKHLRIEGHTDTDPISASAWASNWELGCARSLAVLDFIASRPGMDESNMSAATYGEFMPVATNATDEGKAANRRAIIKVFDN